MSKYTVETFDEQHDVCEWILGVTYFLKTYPIEVGAKSFLIGEILFAFLFWLLLGFWYMSSSTLLVETGMMT